MKMVLNYHLRQRLNHIPETVVSMESEGVIFRTSIVEMAARSHGSKVGGVSVKVLSHPGLQVTRQFYPTASSYMVTSWKGLTPSPSWAM